MVPAFLHYARKRPKGTPFSASAPDWIAITDREFANCTLAHRENMGRINGLVEGCRLKADPQHIHTLRY
jgi:hypothetical protein